MAEESLKMISTALEKLTVTQSSSSWARHLKTPDLFKPDTRDELKQWSDWKFSFENYAKGIDAYSGLQHEARGGQPEWELRARRDDRRDKVPGHWPLQPVDLLPPQPTIEPGATQEAEERLRGMAETPERNATSDTSKNTCAFDPIVTGPVCRGQVYL